jgi:hypothetical protein
VDGANRCHMRIRLVPSASVPLSPESLAVLNSHRAAHVFPYVGSPSSFRSGLYSGCMASRNWKTFDPEELAVAIGLLIVISLCAGIGLIDWAL